VRFYKCLRCIEAKLPAVANVTSRVTVLLLLLLLLFPASVAVHCNFLIKPPTGSTVAQC